MNPFSEELESLRDKANLALGYALLQNGEPSAARPILEDVVESLLGEEIVDETDAVVDLQEQAREQGRMGFGE